MSRQQLIDQAETHLKEGNLHQALVELSQAVKQDPGNATVHADLAWVYLYLNQPENASQEIQWLRKLAPEHEDLPYLQGTLYHQLEQWVDALEAYNDALKNHLNDPQLHTAIAEVFLELNNPDAALREYQVASRLDTANSTAFFGQCMAYRQMKRYDKAIQACQTAVSLSVNPEEKEKIAEVVQTIQLLQSLDPKTPVSRPVSSTSS